MFGRPARRAPPESARNSRWRENHITITLASIPNRTSSAITVMKYPGPWSRSERKTALSMMPPTTRERKITNVFSTPWISVSVTMSPFATCEIS